MAYNLPLSNLCQIIQVPQALEFSKCIQDARPQCCIKSWLDIETYKYHILPFTETAPHISSPSKCTVLLCDIKPYRFVSTSCWEWTSYIILFINSFSNSLPPLFSRLIGLNLIALSQSFQGFHFTLPLSWENAFCQAGVVNCCHKFRKYVESSKERSTCDTISWHRLLIHFFQNAAYLLMWKLFV